MRLSELTTLHLGGEIKNYVKVDNEADLIAQIQAADAADENLLVLGGGSNLVATDEPFDGTVIHLVGPNVPLKINAQNEAFPTEAKADEFSPLAMVCAGAQLEWFAGSKWDDVVKYAVKRHLQGIEALSGIPGTVGATPIQNVGAYGQEVSQTIARVRTWDRLENKIKSFSAAECQFGYRNSIFKQSKLPGKENQATGRYVVLSVSFHYFVADLSAPIAYAELAKQLGVEVGQRVPMAQLREKVLEIRASKGMVLIDGDHDTWSAGSFFTNPIISNEQASKLPEAAPKFANGEQVKTSAAWLISNSGIEKGLNLHPERKGAAVSSKHSLALTNLGEASTTDLVELAEYIREQVHRKFGIWLEPEPVQLGVRIGD